MKFAAMPSLQTTKPVQASRHSEASGAESAEQTSRESDHHLVDNVTS